MVLVNQVGHETLVETSAADFTTGGIGADAACDRKQPGSGGAIGAETMNGTKGAGVGLLGQIIRIGGLTEVAAESEYVR